MTPVPSPAEPVLSSRWRLGLGQSETLQISWFEALLRVESVYTSEKITKHTVIKPISPSHCSEIYKKKI